MAEECDKKKLESDYKSEVYCNGKGNATESKKLKKFTPSRCKMYPKRAELVCLSDMIFKLYIVHMASSLTTAVILRLL